MSRLAKRPIAIPSGVEVNASGAMLAVKGPKGNLERSVHRDVVIEVGAEGALVSPRRQTIEARALQGTYAAHVRNMIRGVTEGFTKRLLIEGVGYRWEVSGNTVKLALGFSHPVAVEIPQGLSVVAEKGVLSISGADKDQVGQFAAEIRALKKPEPYKGKGIRYEGEVIRRKQGKKTA